MIVVDTNVISELCRRAPNLAVVRWYTEQRASELFTTAITRGELLFGVLVAPDDEKRDVLKAQIDEILRLYFDDRQLCYDNHAAAEFALLKANSKKRGRPCSTEDAMIAAIARSNGADVATRNVRDFEFFDVGIINPFDASEDICRNDAARMFLGNRPRRSRSVRERSDPFTSRYRTN